MIRNVNDKKSADESAGQAIITVAELSGKFLGGPVFDTKCQNAALGPWVDIKNKWSDWQGTLGCHFPAGDDDNKLRFTPGN
jgi:hypothetical protein